AVSRDRAHARAARVRLPWLQNSRRRAGALRGFRAGKAPPRPKRSRAGSCAANAGCGSIMSAAPHSGGKLIVVTGMSGAGRSTALKAFEDMGYEAVDNLPLSLLPNLLSASSPPPLAIGVDVRTRDFGVNALLATLDSLAAEHNLELKIVFLDCEDDRLVRRYTETRRRHPLAGDRPVLDGI